MPGDPVALEIPADPRYLTTARVFARSTGRRLGILEDRVDDLTLATSDSCALMMRWATSDGPTPQVHICISRDETRLIVGLELDDDVAPAAPDSLTGFEQEEMLLALALIDAVTDDFPVFPVDGASTVGFSFRLQSDA